MLVHGAVDGPPPRPINAGPAEGAPAAGGRRGRPLTGAREKFSRPLEAVPSYGGGTAKRSPPAAEAAPIGERAVTECQCQGSLLLRTYRIIFSTRSLCMDRLGRRPRFLRTAQPYHGGVPHRERGGLPQRKQGPALQHRLSIQKRPRRKYYPVGYLKRKRSMYYILLAFCYGVSILPLWLLYFISDGLYVLVYHILGYRRKVVLEKPSPGIPRKNRQRAQAAGPQILPQPDGYDGGNHQAAYHEQQIAEQTF